MNSDFDNRLLPPGEYREANNVVIINTEGSDEGSVQKSLSNKRLTNLNLGTNPETVGHAVNEARAKIYYFVVSDTGSFIIEWDESSQSASYVLRDTRTLADRVFSLNKTKYVTGVEIISSDDIKKELMVITDDNMQPLCINIERAKTYGENNFEKEDIFMIKKPPRYAPKAALTYTGGLNNKIEQLFIAFSYRYKYLDGEYSALSPYTNYLFGPKEYDLDYYTSDNLGMVNAFNAVRIAFDTGDKRVTDVQLFVKQSGSNVWYNIESFNKEKEAWGNGITKSFLFSNSKIYTALPVDELYRRFDNVPLLAKALTVMENRVIYGNYVENFNIADASGNKIKVDFSLDLKSTSLDKTVDFVSTESVNSLIINNDAGLALTQGKKIIVSFVIEDTSNSVLAYDKDFYYILQQDFDNLSALFNDLDFVLFLNSVSEDYLANYFAEIPAGWVVVTNSTLGFFVNTLQEVFVTATQAVFKDTLDGDAIHTRDFRFRTESYASLGDIAINTSCKTNRDYEAVITYMDEFGRATVALASTSNTFYIPQDFLGNQNKLKVFINSLAPAFADRYKIAVKTKVLGYETIVITTFFNENLYTWCLLEGDNRDKVKVNDVLILKKSASRLETSIIKVKVLEVKDQPKDFIPDNVDDEGNPILEQAGKYMRIKPTQFSMAEGQYKIYQDSRPDVGSSNYPTTYMSLFSKFDEMTPTVPTGQIAIPQGSSIYLYINSSRNYSTWKNNTYEVTHYAQRNYDTLQEWFEDNILNRPLFGNVGNENQDYQDNLEIVKGYYLAGPFGQIFQEDPTGLTYLKIVGTKQGGSGGNKGYVRFNIVVRTSEGYYVFETEENKNIDTDIYYETEQTFDIVDGYHTANVQSQDASHPTAEIELDFYNCFAYANGVESYKIKDGLNTNKLSIDLRPVTTSIEEYKQIRRRCDLTYGGTYIESTNINAINEFNLSTANYKELDKQYGSIQKLYGREGDVLVLQENKPGQVLYNKNAIYTLDGDPSIVGTPLILGEYIPYNGNRGIGTHPESFSVDDKGRVKYASVKNGVMARLSRDGVEDIVYGLTAFFRKIFSTNKNAKIITGFDPHYGHTVLAIGNEPEILPLFQCSSQIIKYIQTAPFSYNLLLNNLGGDIIFTYNITQGNATITAIFNGNTNVVSNVTGTGTVTIPRDSLVENVVTITITPVSGPISYTITNTCPIGSELIIVSMVLNDGDDTGQTMTNRFKTNTSSFLSNDDLFLDAPLTRFETISGLEGVGAFPANGNLMTIQAYKDNSNSGHFATTECNRLGYLVSSIIYNQTQYQAILDNPDTVFLTVATTGEEGFAITNSGNFVFNRTAANERLYLIWDYTSRNPIIADDSANVNVGQSVIIDVLANDEVGPDAVVTIGTPPLYGTAVVGIDKKITYTHDGSGNLNDSFTYVVTDGGCSSTANVVITVGISCGGSVNASGGTGIYETIINLGTTIGYAGIQFNSQSVPDRWQMYWNDVLVADSKYVGDGISPGPPTSYPGLLGAKTLSVFEYNGTSFVNTGTTEDITVIQSDIADNVTEPFDGNGYATFNKTTPFPTTVLIRTTGATGGTAWNLLDVICPVLEEDLVDGVKGLYWGFFVEASKTLKSISIGIVYSSTENRFYANIFGINTMAVFGWSSTKNYINNGTTWWRIDLNGNILETGSV